MFTAFTKAITHYTTIRSASALRCCCRLITNDHQPAASSAQLMLSQCVKDEVKLEKLVQEPLPKFTKFKTILNGSHAILEHKNGNERVTVSLNVNEAVEIEREDVNEDDEDSETDCPLYFLFLPMFTVTISNPSGYSLSCDCSFDNLGDYSEPGDEWDNFTIDSVRVQEKGDSTDRVYKVDPMFLSKNFQENLVLYLEEKGIDKTFMSEIVSFYREFEHSNYVNEFLVKIDKFLSN